MASSILPGSSSGRIVTIRPEAGAASDLCVVSGPAGEEVEFAAGGHPAVRETSAGHSGWESRTGYAGRFTRGSEALEYWEPAEELVELPTRSRMYEQGKRYFDLALAAVISPVLAVLIAAIGGIIAVTYGTPVFYRQRRIGRHGRLFDIWKFRTMYPHADRILAEHLKHDAAARDEWFHTHKLKDDPRITRLGRVLRKTSLDELPQILNVFSGEMSFVGPRPIVEAEVVKYAERFPYYLEAVPGITGLWQVSGRCDLSYEARVILDETYVSKWSLRRDLWILLKTPKAVVDRDGAY